MPGISITMVKNAMVILGFICMFYHWHSAVLMAFISNFSFFHIQIEASSDYVNGKRLSISFFPNDPAAASFLEV